MRVTSESLGFLTSGSGEARRTSESLDPLTSSGTRWTSESLGSLPLDCMPMITELDPVTGLGGTERSSNRMSCSADDSPTRRSPLGDFLAERSIVSLARSGLATPSWNSERSRSSRFSPLAAGQLVDVNHPEPPGAAIEERADLAVLSLGLELLGTHAQDAGGFFQCIKLSHGCSPRGQNRPVAAVVESIQGRQETANYSTRQAGGLQVIASSAEPES